ncbi:hypothetical protein ACFLYT_01125 [Nanoarchaeota archaeon]
MQIKINIQKTHLYIVAALIVILFGAMLTLAAATPTAKIFHTELAVDRIVGYDSSTTTIDNNLHVTGDVIGVDWSKIENIPVDFSDGIDNGNSCSLSTSPLVMGGSCAQGEVKVATSERDVFTNNMHTHTNVYSCIKVTCT